MRKKILTIFLLFMGTFMASNATENVKTIYDYKVKSSNGKEISLADYKGKVVLIVNTASKCGFTPQFQGLEDLYKKYQDSGFVILGFPCNQFKSQDPGTNEEILSFCQLNYGVTFPMFAKIEVNGDSADPLYKYLKNSLKGFMGEAIKWNFTKFLIGKDGVPIERYAPQTKPESIEDDIKKAL